MMHDFLSNNYDELTARCRDKVARRTSRNATNEQLQNGVPMFLNQLIRTLRIEQTSNPMDSREISGPSGGGSAVSEMGVTAIQHGRALLKLGFTVDQVVHDYGDLCQAITDLAYERDAPFLIDEFRTLNRCLDNAIADAVTEFSYQRDSAISDSKSAAENTRFGYFAHELRNHLGTATLAFDAARIGNLNLAGATGTVLERSLHKLRDLITQTLEEVRTTTEPAIKPVMFSAADFIREIQLAAELTAQSHGSRLSVGAVDETLAINGQRELLFSALANLLQNAFKFTKPATDVALNVYVQADRLLISVIDQCGGLPPGAADKMFLPYMQLGQDRTGVGLGLSIAKHSVELCDGKLSVEDKPGIGCVFTISLPRFQLP